VVRRDDDERWRAGCAGDDLRWTGLDARYYQFTD
jgi:hypothetical protein